MTPVLYSADWVLPVSSPPIRGGAVLVDNGRIAWVGPQSETGNLPSELRQEQLGATVLMPGLVNAHTHLELTTLRGFLEGFEFKNWLRTLHAARSEVLTRDDLLHAARLGIAEGLQHGITTMADTSESAVPIHAMNELGVRGIVYVEVFGPDNEQCRAAIAQLRERVLELRQNETPLVRVGISPHAPYTVSASLFRATAQLAQKENLPLAVHIAESKAEVLFVRDGAGPFAERLRTRGISVEAFGASPVALLKACGVLDVQPLLIHAIQVDDTDMADIAATGATIVHCPVSNAKLGHGIAPLESMIAHGISVGLGSDSVASNDRMHLLEEARQATLFHSLLSGRPDSLTAKEALALATIGGAKALRMEQHIGSLEVGKSADLAAFPLPINSGIPVYDPEVTLVHILAGHAMASLTVVNGVELQRHGALTGRGSELFNDSRLNMELAAQRLMEWRKH